MRMFRKQLAAYEEDVIRQVLVVHRPYTQSGVLDRCPTVFQDLHEVRRRWSQRRASQPQALGSRQARRVGSRRATGRDE